MLGSADTVVRGEIDETTLALECDGDNHSSQPRSSCSLRFVSYPSISAVNRNFLLCPIRNSSLCRDKRELAHQNSGDNDILR